MDWIYWFVIVMLAFLSVLHRLSEYCGDGWMSPQYQNVTFRRAVRRGIALVVFYAIFFWLIWPIRWINENPEDVDGLIRTLGEIVMVVLWLVLTPFRLLRKLPRFLIKLRLNPILNSH